LEKKARLTSPGWAWIPGYGPFIIAFKASKMHWWPWLLLIGVVIPKVGFVAGIIFTIFATMWQWKLLDSIKRPGWWALLGLIPGVWLIILWLVIWKKK